MNMSCAVPQNTRDGNPADLGLDVLHARMAVELCELASICRAVENALGELISNPKNPMDDPVITLQGLDRLRQSLEDMARLTNLIARDQNNMQSDSISTESIHATIVLSELATRLTGEENSSTAAENNDLDVIWG